MGTSYHSSKRSISDMMRILLVLLLISVSSQGRRLQQDDDNKVKFNVIASRSIEEPPTIDVTFGNGVKDSLDLQLFQINSEASSSCCYIGRLHNSPSSSVAATGCLNKAGDVMDITIISKNNINKMFTVDFDGNTEIIKNPYGEEGQSVAMIMNRDGTWHKEGGDEMVNDSIENAANAVSVTSVPSKLKASIAFGYDYGLEEYLKSVDQTFESWIAKVFPHAQAHFRHSESLGTEIEFEVVGPAIKAVNDNSHWTADKNLRDAVSQTSLAKRNGIHADTFSWFCNRGGGSVAGIAYLGTLCGNFNQNLNERQSNDAASGFVLAHELGHNFGMKHDFDRAHGGWGGPCNGKGIMSYGSFSYNQWSTCSKSDWEHHYTSEKWGLYCLENLAVPNDTQVEVAPCGSTITNSGTVVKSARFPVAYPSDEDCEWFVQFEGEEKVQLEFTHFSLEPKSRWWGSIKIRDPNADCVDWVEVRDGPDSNATLVGKFCDSVKPESITSTGNSLYVRFVSDIYRAESGFRAVVTKVGAATTVSPTTIAPTEGPDVTTQEPEPCFDNDAQYKGEAVKKPGKKYKLTNILSALDCQQKCQENPKCEYFTWNAGTGPGRWNKKNKNTCWLKKNKGNVRRSSKDSGKISGKKEC